MSWKACLGVACAVGLLGCGDDDEAPPPTDGGPPIAIDTGTGTPDGGRMDAGRRDSGMDAGSGPAECSPFVEGVCGEGLKCSVIIDVRGPDDVDVRYGCVSAEVARAEGIVCSRGIDATPKDSSDEVFTDNCHEGLFCWEDPARVGINTCQRLCGEEGVDCADTSFCLTLNSDPPFGVCTPTSGCDPVYQVGCTTGQGCYVVGSTTGNLLGTCFDFAPQDGGTGMAGEACRFIDSCQPGTQCFVDFYPDGGTGTMPTCHTLCNAGDPDAGAPPDAGSAGICTGTLMCAALPLEMGGMVRTPTPPGSCQ